MCGSAQKGGINADTIAPSLSRCGFIDPAVRGSEPREGGEEEGVREEDKEREKERGRAGIQKCYLCCGGVYLSTLQPQQEAQPLRNSHIEDDTCGWLTTCFLWRPRSDHFMLSDCF